MIISVSVEAASKEDQENLDADQIIGEACHMEVTM